MMAPSDKKLETELRSAVREVARKNREELTVNNVRRFVEEKLDLEQGFFSSEAWKGQSKTIIKTAAVSCTRDDASLHLANLSDHDRR